MVLQGKVYKVKELQTMPVGTRFRHPKYGIGVIIDRFSKSVPKSMKFENGRSIDFVIDIPPWDEEMELLPSTYSDAFVKGDYVIENKRSCDIKHSILLFNPGYFLTKRNGWSKNPIFNEIEVFLIKNTSENLVLLVDVCVIKDIWIPTKPKTCDEWKMRRNPDWKPHELISKVDARGCHMQTSMTKDNFNAKWMKLPIGLRHFVDRFVEDNIGVCAVCR